MNRYHEAVEELRRREIRSVEAAGVGLDELLQFLNLDEGREWLALRLNGKIGVNLRAFERNEVEVLDFGPHALDLGFESLTSKNGKKVRFVLTNRGGQMEVRWGELGAVREYAPDFEKPVDFRQMFYASTRDKGRVAAEAAFTRDWKGSHAEVKKYQLLISCLRRDEKAPFIFTPVRFLTSPDVVEQIGCEKVLTLCDQILAAVREDFSQGRFRK